MHHNFDFSNTNDIELEEKNANAPTSTGLKKELSKVVESFVEKVDHSAFEKFFSNAISVRVGKLTSSSIEHLSSAIHSIDVSEIQEKLNEVIESSSEHIGDFAESSSEHIEDFVEGLVSGLFDF